MKLFKTVSALFAGLTLSIAPAMAKVDSGTPALLQSLPAYGVTVALNPTECDGTYHGSFHTGTRKFVVCYDGRPDANDHDTVRHEAMHVAQSCAANREGRRGGIRTILKGAALKEFYTNVLTPREIQQIKSIYPRQKWDTELEAFAGAKLYTADQITHIVSSWCGSWSNCYSLPSSLVKRRTL